MYQKANRRFGQHFLVSASVSSRIVDWAGVVIGDRVLEIGPGRGALTQLLLDRGAHVLAIEIDRTLGQELETQFAGQPQLQLVLADVLQIDLRALLASPPRRAANASWKLVSNLPYNEATAILQRLIEIKQHLHSITVMLQREVADRLLAAPRTKQIGFLTHLLGYHFEIRRGFSVKAGSFRPAPKVLSTVIQLLPRQDLVSLPDYSFYVELLQHGFSQRRKMLQNTLRPLRLKNGALAAALLQRGLRPEARAESLSRDDFIWLASRLLKSQVSNKTGRSRPHVLD